MKPLFNIFFIAGILFVSTPSFAQPKTAASWSAKFTSAINWQRVHSLGYIIVSTNDGLYGVNPTDGKIIWENKKYAALDPSLLEEVEGTEFLTITFKTDQSSAVPLQALIEVTGGKVLFDSQNEGIGVLSRHVLPLSGRLLIIGVKKGKDLKDLVATLFMYDIQSGKQLWMNDELFKPDAPATKGFLGKLQTLGQQFGNLQKLTSEPLEVDAQNVVITHPSYVMKLKSETGELVWKNKITTSKNAAILFSPYKKNVTFVATEVESESGSGFTTGSNQQGPAKFYTNLYYAFDSNTGSPLWKQPAKENDHMNQVIMHEKGIIICPRSSQKPTINLVNYETGETVWGNKGKGIKAQGSVVNYLPTDNGILITTAFDISNNNKAEEYYLNVLDPSAGKLKYEKSVKLKGDLVRSELVPKGLLFITTREVNILDVNTGTQVWENSIESGRPSLQGKVKPFPTGGKGNKLYVYSAKDESVYEVDKQAGTNRKITSSKIQFEGKESPKNIDAVDDGLVLTSEQNIIKVTYDGVVKFSKYYPAPRQPALVRALLLAQAIQDAYIGAAASVYSASFEQAAQKTTDPGSKAIGQGLSKGFGQLGDAGFAYSAMAMKQFSARYKASKNTPAFVMMMTVQEKKGNQLIQVSKSSGVILSAIDIKNDREPEYDVDQIYNYVYYRPNPTEIVCYKL